MADSVIVRHKKTGEEYGVTKARAEREIRKDGELEGYEIVSMADGSAYEPPAPKSAPKKADKA